ncbi:MAG: hypothetical protein JO131_06385 [Gammaproteobacteria bacterium]|nr:hypothetical protein [Gammaproteobacteria bacterium]
MQRKMTTEFKPNLSSQAESKHNLSSKKPALQDHIELFADEQGYITKASINDVFTELQEFERQRQIDALLKLGKEKEAKTLLATPIPPLKEGDKVFFAARFIFCIAGSRFFGKGGKMLPKDVIAMMHPGDTGFYDRNGFLSETFIQTFLKDDFYFKLDKATNERVITRERFSEFMRETKALGQERWKDSGCVLKQIGPHANINEFDFMFRFFYSYEDTTGNKVITDKDFYAFEKNTLAHYAKKFPQSRLPAVAYFNAGIPLPQPKENCCTWAMNGVKGLLFSAASKLPHIKGSQSLVSENQENLESKESQRMKVV